MLNQDFQDILSAFSDAGVEYLLVGAYALSAHGLVRSTGDIDLWVHSTPDNASRVYSALVAFGAPTDKFSIDDFTEPNAVVQLGVPPIRIDILTSVSGVEFDDAWQAKSIVELGGVGVPVMSRAHLIANKKASGRPKDLIDWLSQVIAHQKELTDSQLEELIGPAIREAVQSSLASGVTCIGDISRFCQLTRPLLCQGPLRVVSFGEVIGIGKRRHLVPDRLRSAADTTHQSRYLTTALSPHAPYSLEEDGVRQVVAQARSNRMRLAAHLAETEEELEFLRTGGGRFREFLEILDVWDDQVPVPRKTPIRWADSIDLLGPD